MEALGVTVESATPESPVEKDRLRSPGDAQNAGRAVEFPRVLMVAGGTGGHIFPALAVAEELIARRQSGHGAAASSFIQFLGTTRGLESRLIPAAGFPLRTVCGAGLKGIGGWRKLLNLMVLPQSAIETAQVLRKFQPDVVVGAGGYLAGPAMLESALRDIPTLLLETNAVPGFTNRVLAPVVRLAAVGFEETARFYGSKAVVTGHPVRRSFNNIPPKAHVPPFTVLIQGGSQGSAAINECVLKSLPLLSTEAGRLRVIHQTGVRDYHRVRDAYLERGFNAEVHPFIQHMPEAFARADLVVSRAGATAVAELAAAGKAALLIPFPAATDHHQLENARVFERAGAARLIEQAKLTPGRLVEELWGLLGEPKQLVRMEQCVKGLARPGAAERIAELVEGLAVGRPLSVVSGNQKNG